MNSVRAAHIDMWFCYIKNWRQTLVMSYYRLDQLKINEKVNSVKSRLAKLSDPAPVVDAKVGARCRLLEGLELAIMCFQFLRQLDIDFRYAGFSNPSSVVERGQTVDQLVRGTEFFLKKKDDKIQVNFTRVHLYCMPFNGVFKGPVCSEGACIIANSLVDYNHQTDFPDLIRIMIFFKLT